MQTTQIRNHPPAVPVRIAVPAGWEELYADAPLLAALRTYSRLSDERSAAVRAVAQAEKDLQTAALQDRADLAAAIGSNSALPTSDKHARKAADALAESIRLRDATIEAFALSSYTVERLVGERKVPVLADLEARIATAQAEAEAEAAELGETFATLAALRRAAMFVRTRGARSNWVPASGSWAKTSEQLHMLISEPAPSSAEPVLVSDGDGAEGAES